MIKIILKSYAISYVLVFVFMIIVGVAEQNLEGVSIEMFLGPLFLLAAPFLSIIIGSSPALVIIVYIWYFFIFFMVIKINPKGGIIVSVIMFLIWSGYGVYCVAHYFIA